MRYIDILLGALDNCRPTGTDQWISRCPAHDDKSPSLSVRLLADSRILIHCHAGCGAIDVLESVGMDWSCLMPDEPKDHYRKGIYPRKDNNPTYDECLLAICKDARGNGESFTQEDEQAELEAFVRTRG